MANLSIEQTIKYVDGMHEYFESTWKKRATFVRCLKGLKEWTRIVYCVCGTKTIFCHGDGRK